MPQPGSDVQIDGYGVTVRYTPSHLRVTWDNQSEMTVRPTDRKITAHIEIIHLNVTVVMFSLKVEMAVPDPGTGRIEMLLAFPPHLEAEVRGLAERLGSDAAAWQSPAGQARTTHQPVPHQAPPTHPQPPQLPLVRFWADLTAWTDDPEWIGLYPSLETARLLVTRPAEPSPETGSYPSA